MTALLVLLAIAGYQNRDNARRLGSGAPRGKALLAVCSGTWRDPSRSCSDRRSRCLAEFDGYRFRVFARCAFKRPLVVTGLIGWFNARKKHWQSALRASPLANWRVRRIKIMGLRHGGTLWATRRGKCSSGYEKRKVTNHMLQCEFTQRLCRFL